jgi:hypothetical protein
VRPSLRGQGRLTLRKGRLTQFELGRVLLSPVTNALQSVGLQKRPAPQAPAGRGTALQDLDAQLAVADGWIRLQQPLELRADVGRAELTGGMDLEGHLDLRGAASLRPQAVSAAVGHAPPGSLEYPLTIGGTLAHPSAHARIRPGQVVGLVLSRGSRGAASLGQQALRQLRRLGPFSRQGRRGR